MKTRPSLWRGRLPRTLAAAVIVGLLPWPVAAADQAPPAPTTQNITASAQKVAATERLVVPQPVAAKQNQGSDAALTSPSFFKTKVGLAVLAVVLGGAGYAIYSTSHDRIHSEARQGQ